MGGKIIDSPRRLSVRRDYQFAEIISLQRLSVRRNYQFAEIVSLPGLSVRGDYRLELKIVSY